MQELLSQFCIEGLKVRETSEVDVLRSLAQCLWLPSPSGERANACRGGGWVSSVTLNCIMIMYWKGCSGSIQHSETGCPGGLNQVIFCVKIYFLTRVEKMINLYRFLRCTSPPAKPLLRDGCWKTCPSSSVIQTNKLHTGHCSE